MAGNATTDGVDFQCRLCYYVIGLVHDKYNYSVLNEGGNDTYGALDDVILKIDAKGAYNKGLYLFQAKQGKDETKTLSIQDVLQDKKTKVAKYIDAYIKYSDSEACSRDGEPTEMIYWTVKDLHATTRKFFEEHISSEPHLVLTIDSIKKYRIKHWKALFMFETAHKLANDYRNSGRNSYSKSRKEDNPNTITYLNESVADEVARAILEKSPDSEGKVRFREDFLQEASSLTENAKQFRISFIVACEMLYTNPKTPTFDITSEIKSNQSFSTDAFNTEKLDAPATYPAAFQYNEAAEEKLEWFFEHFIFYVGVPKDNTMAKAIVDLFGDQFNEEIFKTHLITNPRERKEEQRKAKQRQPQQDCFISKSDIELLLRMIELKKKLVVKPPKGIKFEGAGKLNATINSFRTGEEHEFTVLTKTKVDWTAARITKEFENRNSLSVSNGTDLQLLLEELLVIQTTPFGERLISGEVQFVILLDLPDIAQCLKQIAEQLENKMKVIAIVTQSQSQVVVPSVVDEVELCDVKVDYEQLEIKCISFDGKTLPIANYLTEETINSISKLEELSTLTDITVKSDVYDFGERQYIDRNLLGKGGKIVSHAELLSRSPSHAVSIICDTAGQGKTTELLRIGKVAQNIDEVICLYVRARTIAKGITQDANTSYIQMLQKLLHITPNSLFVNELVQRSLEKEQVCLLVDGFDEVLDEYQNLVTEFLVKMLQHTARCSLVIATRHESLPVLKKGFKNASYYSLAPFPYDQYFRQLWLSEPNEITPDLEKNVEKFIADFDQLLKGTGCKSFLEVPQLCKIMGTIYHDRIRKPNIQKHTNYEIGSIYDTFVQSQLENTLRGKFDEMDKLHVWARNLIKSECYTKHAQLAYELEYNCFSNLEHYEQLRRFGLIIISDNGNDKSESVNFMHRTVMDYFLVRICMLHDIDEERFHSFLKRYFCVSRANIADKFIDFFLQDTQCLSSRKKDIISWYLNSGSNTLPTCIRTALNNATFNTLRVLLSVAPIELLRPLCFRFGANDSNEINLKRLGEEQTLLLLKALQKCDDEYADADGDNGDLSILERMLFEADLNKEDTMEVAIRKPFPKVFDWVVEYCTTHFNMQIEHYLRKRIQRYARAIISHCYAENKEKIIDKILELMDARKTTFCGEMFRQWLESFDLLRELIVSIEFVPQGKQFKEDDRKDLTLKILEMLDKYLGEESLIVIKEQSSKEVEKIQNEAIKSELKKWMKIE